MPPASKGHRGTNGRRVSSQGSQWVNAAAIAIKPTHGFERTYFQRLAEHVAGRNRSSASVVTFISKHALSPQIFRSKRHQQVYISSKPRRRPPVLRGLKTLAACPLGFIRFAPISPPHRTSMLHSRRRDRPPAVLPKLHSASRKTLSPRRRVSITRPATATQPGLARAQWPPQHAHMIHPYGNPAFARPSRMR